MDGLRLAVEIKPINLAVGRAVWNRFGDVRAFAVNIHLKFPFAVVGGVLVIPVWEWAKLTSGALTSKRSAIELANEPADTLADVTPERGDLSNSTEADETAAELSRKSTLPLIERLIRRLDRTRRRESEADAPHLLEAIAVIVYDPDIGRMVTDLPPEGSGLRWDAFVATVGDQYDARFED
jgi:hypothetical protein